MRNELRLTVRRLYGFRCGYCGVSETDTGAKLTIDHFQPRTLGGEDDLDNLVYCCHARNEFKGDYWHTEQKLRLLHPLRDDLTQHYAKKEDGMLESFTELGANHIPVLHLNREELVEQRREKQAIAGFQATTKVLEDRLSDLEQTARTIQAQIARLFGDVDS